MNAAEPHRIPSTGDRCEPTRLRAGPLTVLWVDGDLRGIRWCGREAVRRLHGTVRDRNWGTVPGGIRDLRIEPSADAFRISYHREHRLGEIHFEWRAEILGGEDGTIRFDFDGVAVSSFLANRIGLCLLHPIRECAGAACRTLHADGSSVARAFPELVAVEQPIRGFTDLTGLAHEVAPGIWVEASFEGGLFETEDQRNWIDASFKTYSPPLKHAFPVAIRSGSRIHQAVVLRLRGLPGRRAEAPPGTEVREPASISLVDTGTVPLPGIGLGIATNAGSIAMPERERLAGLGLSHLRTDVHPARSGWEDRLAAARRDAANLGVALELALHLPREGADRLGDVARELCGPGGDCGRVLVLREGRPATGAGDLAAARRALSGSRAAVGAGTDADLYQLHLQPPPVDGDFLSWSMNPQVHATDDMSLLETPEAAGHQIAALRLRHPGLSLVVSPITLKRRFNPVATTPGLASEEGEQPPPGDPRQKTLLAAAWTVAMFKALAEGGVAALTFFETTGPAGVMESGDGRVFPVYHALADIGEFARGRILPTRSGEPSAVHPVLFRHGRDLRLLVANGTPGIRRVTLPWRVERGRLRSLDPSTAGAAMEHPERYRSIWNRFDGDRMELQPYAIVTLDFTED